MHLNGRHLLADDEGIMYSLGIIDIFQEYDYLKAGEKNIKSLFNAKERVTIATPADYCLRISEFCSEIFQ